MLYWTRIKPADFIFLPKSAIANCKKKCCVQCIDWNPVNISLLFQYITLRKKCRAYFKISIGMFCLPDHYITFIENVEHTLIYCDVLSCRSST